MYDIIERIIDHSYIQGDSLQSYYIYTCCVLIIIFTVVFIDMVYRVFTHFWRGGK